MSGDVMSVLFKGFARYHLTKILHRTLKQNVTFICN